MRLFALSWCLFFCALGVAQQRLAGKATFEVASIKRTDENSSSPMFIGMKADAGTVRYSNITLKDCIRAAYRVRSFQIQAPDWMNSAHFDISAKIPAGASLEQIPEMMQQLLAERFGLVLQHGTKEQSVYALVVGKGSPKLKPALAPAEGEPITALGVDGRPRQSMMIQFMSSGIGIQAPAASLAAVADVISRFMERPVVDLTGLEGQYHIELTFEPETMGGMENQNVTPDGAKTAASEPAPSLGDAVQQYGLKLEARKVPLELLIVTHAEKTPTEN